MIYVAPISYKESVRRPGPWGTEVPNRIQWQNPRGVWRLCRRSL